MAFIDDDALSNLIRKIKDKFKSTEQYVDDKLSNIGFEFDSKVDNNTFNNTVSQINRTLDTKADKGESESAISDLEREIATKQDRDDFNTTIAQINQELAKKEDSHESEQRFNDIQELITTKQDVMSANNGIKIESNTIKHTNSVTANSVGSAVKIPIIQYDGQGHIVSSSEVSVYPPTSQGINGQYWVSDGEGEGYWQTLVDTIDLSNDSIGADLSQAIRASAVKQLYLYLKQFIVDEFDKHNNPLVTIVDELPTENISSNTLYLIVRTEGEQEELNIYDEYAYLTVGGVSFWEKIGSTKIDLGDYVKTTDFESRMSTKANADDVYTKSETNELVNAKYSKPSDGIPKSDLSEEVQNALDNGGSPIDVSTKLDVDGTNGTASGVSALINKLTEGSSDPVDNDFYVAQYANGGTTTTTYHRRPIKALWNYIKSKADNVYQLKGYLSNYFSSRPSSADQKFNDGRMVHFKATSTMTTNKPKFDGTTGDAHIIHLAWDNTGLYDSQIAIRNASSKMAIRSQNGTTWDEWKDVALKSDIPTSLPANGGTSNYATYAVAHNIGSDIGLGTNKAFMSMVSCNPDGGTTKWWHIINDTWTNEDDTWKAQIAFPTYQSAQNGNQGDTLWFRYKSSATAWSSWRRLARYDELTTTITKIEYQRGTSANTAPTGTWTTTIPNVIQGQYLWTRVTFSDNKVMYSVARQGIDGAVTSVAGKTGAVTLAKGDVGLGNVENTALSSWAGTSKLTTCSKGTFGDACTKGVVSSLTESTTSTDLPTASQVASLVKGKASLGKIETPSFNYYTYYNTGTWTTTKSAILFTSYEISGYVHRKYIITITSSGSLSASKSGYLRVYDFPENVLKGTNTYLSVTFARVLVGTDSGGLEYAYKVDKNASSSLNNTVLEVRFYNRNSSTAWGAGDSYVITVDSYVKS